MNAVPATLDQARLAKPKALEIVRSHPELHEALTGIGISFAESGYGLKINFSTRVPWEAVLPASIDGVPLQVEIVGRVEGLI